MQISPLLLSLFSPCSVIIHIISNRALRFVATEGESTADWADCNIVVDISILIFHIFNGVCSISEKINLRVFHCGLMIHTLLPFIFVIHIFWTSNSFSKGSCMSFLPQWPLLYHVSGTMNTCTVSSYFDFSIMNCWRWGVFCLSMQQHQHSSMVLYKNNATCWIR